MLLNELKVSNRQIFISKTLDNFVEGSIDLSRTEVKSRGGPVGFINVFYDSQHCFGNNLVIHDDFDLSALVIQ